MRQATTRPGVCGVAESSPWSFSLTREDILARKMKREQIAEELEKLQRQLEAEDKWFEAIKLIVPHDLLSSIEEAVAGAKEGPEKVSIWRQAVADALAAADFGMLPKDVALFIKEHGSAEAKERIVRNPNGVYNALYRMHKDGQIVRHGDKFYRIDLYEDLLASGELDDDADDRGSSGVNAFILSLVGEWDRVLPRDVIAKLREHEEYSKRVERNPQYGYSALARLVRQGRLEKDGAYYSRTLKKNEPSDVPASNGSDAGSDDDGRPRALRLV